MNPISVSLLLIAGMFLGVIFYGGLWLTVRSLPTARHPVWLTLSSFWIRTLIVVGSFVVLMRGNWKYAVISLLGFTLGRLAVSKYFPAETARRKCP
jgi:F1F0 ATPase subunit 2